MSHRYFSFLIFLSSFLFIEVTLAKTVLVTGSNRGMGLEFVSQYAERGWNVIATSRSPSDDNDLINLAKMNPNIQIEKMDGTNVNEILSLADKYESQSTDLLINNLG